MNSGVFPMPPWLANGGSSKWLAPRADQSGSAPAGTYTYRTTFDLTGSTWRRWCRPGGGDGQHGGDEAERDACEHVEHVRQLDDVNVYERVRVGVNTLEFVVTNFSGTVGNPTGVRVEVSGTGLPPAPTPGDADGDAGGGDTRPGADAAVHGDADGRRGELHLRLAGTAESTAYTTGPQWGQSYAYDGWGNLAGKTVTKDRAWCSGRATTADEPAERAELRRRGQRVDEQRVRRGKSGW